MQVSRLSLQPPSVSATLPLCELLSHDLSASSLSFGYLSLGLPTQLLTFLE
jgi:hypothetical protein